MSAACTLYEIEYELTYLLDTLEGLLPEDDEAHLELEAAVARAVQAEIQKVDGISHLLAHFESQAQLAAAECKRLQARKKAFERTPRSASNSTCAAPWTYGRRKRSWKSGTTTLSLRVAPASVRITNFDAVPAAYKEIRTEVVINKDAVKKALMGGAEGPRG